MILNSNRYLRVGGVICMIFQLFIACRPVPILPPGPNSISVEAKVPTRIYSNIKKVILDASYTSTLNAPRALFFSWTCTLFPALSVSPEIKFKELPIAYVENLSIGEYKFELTVKDNLGNINISSYQLEVLEDSITGKVPIAKAGPDQQIKAPQHIAELDGSETLTNNTLGRQLDFKWAVILQPSGSSLLTFNNSIFAVTKVDGLQEGFYKFQLKVTNEYGKIALDTANVTVLPDPLKGTVRIFDKVKWNLEGDDDWGLYISLIIKDPDLFINRYPGNMEVKVWENEKNDWSDLKKYFWYTSESGELHIGYNWPGDLESYKKMEEVFTKVHIKIL